MFRMGTQEKYCEIRGLSVANVWGKQWIVAIQQTSNYKGHLCKANSKIICLLLCSRSTFDWLPWLNDTMPLLSAEVILPSSAFRTAVLKGTRRMSLSFCKVATTVSSGNNPNRSCNITRLVHSIVRHRQWWDSFSFRQSQLHHWAFLIIVWAKRLVKTVNKTGFLPEECVVTANSYFCSSPSQFSAIRFP